MNSTGGRWADEDISNVDGVGCLSYLRGDIHDEVDKHKSKARLVQRMKTPSHGSRHAQIIYCRLWGVCLSLNPGYSSFRQPGPDNRSGNTTFHTRTTWAHFDPSGTNHRLNTKLFDPWSFLILRLLRRVVWGCAPSRRLIKHVRRRSNCQVNCVRLVGAIGDSSRSHPVVYRHTWPTACVWQTTTNANSPLLRQRKGWAMNSEIRVKCNTVSQSAMAPIMTTDFSSSSTLCERDGGLQRRDA